jgi:hypothetical protein
VDGGRQLLINIASVEHITYMIDNNWGLHFINPRTVPGLWIQQIMEEPGNILNPREHFDEIIKTTLTGVQTQAAFFDIISTKHHPIPSS